MLEVAFENAKPNHLTINCKLNFLQRFLLLNQSSVPECALHTCFEIHLMGTTFIGLAERHPYPLAGWAESVKICTTIHHSSYRLIAS